MNVRPNRSDRRSRCSDRGPADSDARTPRARAALRLSWESRWQIVLGQIVQLVGGLLILIDQPAVEALDVALQLLVASQRLSTRASSAQLALCSSSKSIESPISLSPPAPPRQTRRPCVPRPPSGRCWPAVCDVSRCSVARLLLWHGEQGGTPGAMGSVEKAGRLNFLSSSSGAGAAGAGDDLGRGGRADGAGVSAVGTSG